MVHSTNIKAADSCHLDIPEYDDFKMFLACLFPTLLETEQAGAQALSHRHSASSLPLSPVLFCLIPVSTSQQPGRCGEVMSGRLLLVLRREKTTLTGVGVYRGELLPPAFPFISAYTAQHESAYSR